MRCTYDNIVIAQFSDGLSNCYYMCVLKVRQCNIVQSSSIGSGYGDDIRRTDLATEK